MTDEEVAQIAEKAASYPVGSRENPIRTFQPSGSEFYLQRLRTSSGRPLQYRRRGSVGVGPYDNILDEYQIRDPDSNDMTSIFIDMYHMFYDDARSPPGLQLLPSRKK